MNESTNEYGLTSTTDSHMIKNIEWGVAAYLTHSKYGMCNNNSCSEVGFNSYYNDVENEYKTGCGPQSNESYNNAAICNLYNTELGQLASTTGNIYGIYDMNGGTYEYVMGNMSSTSSVYTYYQSVANNYFTYSQTTAKYIDTYANGTSYGNQNAYNRARLGDATGEVTTTTTDIGWYNDYSVFAFSEGPWFNRGGTVVDGTNSGIFNFYGYDGSGSSKRSSRAILVSLN